MDKNQILTDLQNGIMAHSNELMEQNRLDIAQNAAEIDAALLDRLTIDSKKIAQMCNAIEVVKNTPDPEGRVLSSYRHPNGLWIENRTVPFGTILIIYESRPDVTVEAAISAFKAGNKILLKGGKEAKNTNLYLVKLWQEALSRNGANTAFVEYLDLDRAETQRLIKENTRKIDLIIPRGGDALIHFVKSSTTVPVLVSGRGNNFAYVHHDADFDMAIAIILNGKKRLSVCNALDKVLFNRNLPGLRQKLNMLIACLQQVGIAIFAEEPLPALHNGLQPVPAGEGLYYEEFLSAKILFGLVEEAEEAIEKINRYSGGHSATIITANNALARQFQETVDCAAVFHNASTRFTDGGEFGLGAEIAISTQKLHFRGPLGLTQLVTNKWYIWGNGQIRE